jgi:phosphate transport system protein
VAGEATRAEFRAQLEGFDGEIRDAFVVVTSSVERATRAFAAGDESVAPSLVEGAGLSRAILTDVERQLELAFARQAPVGIDLRLMITALRVVPQLERCVELARHVAERAGLAPLLPADVLATFAEMGILVTNMWEAASVAWRDRDPTAAESLDSADDEVDVLCNEVAERLARLEEAPLVAMEARLAVRFYERLGDHAVHATERIAYLAGTRDPAR